MNVIYSLVVKNFLLFYTSIFIQMGRMELGKKE